MPADLDDLFTRLGEQADAVPIGTAATARRRGEQRTRTRTMVAAAAAVCLAGGGAVWLVRPATEQRDPHPPAATKGSGPLPGVGSPIPYGSKPRFAMTAIAGDQVFTGWQDEDGTIKVSAADLHTGRQSWPARSPGKFDDFGGILAVPRALLVSVEHNDGTDPDRTMYVYDPATGEKRWELPFDVADDLIFQDDVLIHMVAKTGLTRALTWATGEPRWTLAAPADRPIRTLGAYTPGDEDRGGRYGLPINSTQDHFVQVTRAGNAQTRSVRTGEVLTTATLPAPTEGSTVVEYDQWLYNDEQSADGSYRIRATRLDAPGTTAIIFTGPAGRHFGGLAPCAPQRVCVLDRGKNDETAMLTALDAESRRTLWRVDAPESADTVLSLHGRTLVSGGGETALYDKDGKQVFHTSAMIGWLDAETLFSAPMDEAGPATLIAAADGRPTALGEVPALPNFCSWTPERLACPTETDLRLWTLTG